MRKILFISICCLCFSNFVFSQTPCNLTKSSYVDVYTVQTDDLYCLARNSKKDYTIFYTMAGNCPPCIKHLPIIINFANQNNFDIYILSVDREWEYNSQLVYKTLQKANMQTAEYNSVLLSDSLYTDIEYRRKKPKERGIVISIHGAKYEEKHKHFMNELTDSNEKYYGYSQIIVINKQGKLVFTEDNTGSEKEKKKKTKEDNSFENRLAKTAQTIETDKQQKK